MSNVKGCTNSQCIATKKKIKYKATEDFCSKCGAPLVYVCPKCYTPIEKNEKLCAIHQAKKEDQKDKAIKVVKEGGAFVAAAAVFVWKNGKKIPAHLLKR